RHVVGFVHTHRPDLAAATPATASPAPAVVPADAITAGAAAPPPDPVMATVLGIVAEKTGYPSDMLELDLDLEADLGVDTVKQAETFAAVREAYGIPRLDDLKLRDFPTLRHVVGFVHTHRPDLAAATALTPPVATASTASMAHTDAAAPATDARRYDVEDANRVPRRVVVPSLRPSLTLCRATSVALPPGARVVVGMDGRGVGLALADRLATRGVSVLPVPEDAAADWLDAQMVTWLAEGPIAGVYWLPALDCEPDVAALDLDGFREANRRRTKNLFAVMRPLADVVSKPGTFLVSATSMGGVFGYDADGATAPLGGGVAGFTKAFKRERPDALVKVVDVSAEAPAAAVAEAMLSETLHDPGVVEIGYRDGLRWTLTFDDVPAEDDRSGLTLSADTVYLVTGAAGGITSAIVADLAQAGGGVFYLLDLVDAPAADDRHVALLRTDREQLKAVLIDEARARGDRPTPVTIDRALLAIERRDAARRAIEAVEAAGGDARYRTVDLLDGAAVAAVVDEVRAAHGRLDVLVHAGGIEISRALGEKPRAEFDLVFDIKADGYFSLLRAAEGLPIGASVVFSSVAGRFGNSGQTDYSAANALLCAMSRALRRTRPETRAIAIDWTAWAGIGMATRGSIPKIMEAAGIEMLDPAVGVPTVRRELTAGSRADEIVVGGRLGILAAEWDETGGLDVDRMAVALAGRRQPLGMVGEVRASLLHGGFIAATTLDPGQQPFLHDHRIDGTPVLPGVMGTEAFAQIASALCPDLTVVGVEDAEFLLPFKFFRDQPATLSLRADGRPGTGGDVVVRTSLHSRVQPRPDLPAQDREHFRALVRMRRESPAPLQISFTPPDRTAAAVTRDAIYRVYFHGPAYQVLEGVHLDNGTAVGPMVHGLPPNSVPADAAGLVAPRLIELCFQTAGIVGIARDRALGLPTAFRAVTVHRAPEHANGDRLFAVVTRREEDGVSYDARVVDSHGRVYVDVRGYRTIALAGAVELDDLDPPQG
ncbi:MAG: SDR family NAD(P)-dependent oxidoreductase, partial [Acidobacteria bacterium]|nr:SDR family NAD(P)-dependent oxidoreductase [Acidobacteriota bacterium]